MGLLIALFFYDIFWVFGTDVMITVAKNIDGPIKLLFPKALPVNSSEDLSLLGLGDIVIPGIFISLCLRFDFLNHFEYESPNRSFEDVKKSFSNASKPYFWASMIGYLVAILATILVMFIFNHGQPALLYLVPGCIGSVLLCGFMRKEVSDIWNYNETEEMVELLEETKKQVKGD